MGHGTDGALVTRNLGILGVNVNRLGEPGENNQQNTQQGHKSYVGFWRGLVFSDCRMQ